MGSASLSTGTAHGGSWGGHPSSLLCWPGCPAHRHCGEHAKGAVYSLSPVQARVAKQSCSPLHVCNRGTRMGHPPARHIEGSDTWQPHFGLGGDTAMGC